MDYKWFLFEQLDDSIRSDAADLLEDPYTCGILLRERRIAQMKAVRNHLYEANDNESRQDWVLMLASDKDYIPLVQLWIECQRDMLLTKLSYQPK